MTKNEANAEGNFWLAENVRPNEMIGKLLERGFVVNPDLSDEAGITAKTPGQSGMILTG
ncbi:MAG TPA: hypothetical protein VE954_31035 [Oligoflexus sp.]|uniref:hypothetical protein n=1 Tax=Oligoflexus sp. TaxID=1971216 RepID=UPI002D3B195E|nr:hypothetical protein [Oligoflexus sp.]HYX37560.1 hypothetical protein [Oligoflexus sp.]